MKKEIYTGKFNRAKKGFGFVVLEDEEIFIPKQFTSNAMNGDEVSVSIVKEKSTTTKSEGKIIKILKREHSKIVGRIERSKKAIFVIPDSPKLVDDIFIPKGKSGGAKQNDKVVVNIEKYPCNKSKAEGKVVKILKKNMDYSTDAMSILEEFSIPYENTKEVICETKLIDLVVNKNDINNRVDFRNQMVITIDGEDTKDVDDAISIEKIEDGYILYVHIADVAHYVKEGSAIDQEAKRRSTSVYLINEVVPMLPKQLSNGICSLNEGVDRLCLTVIIKLNNNCKIIDSNITESVINVNHHMTYNQVQAILDGKKDDRFEDVSDMILIMSEVSSKMDIIRQKSGNIDFDTTESKFKVNKKGNIIEILPFIRLEAHRIIENFMICANECVATEYFWRDLPFIYRVHEEPDDEKIVELIKNLANIGIPIHLSNKIYSGQLRKVLEDNKDRVEYPLINDIILRSMMRARYDTHPLGHFGLALDYYSHFTSPIRRYADLVVHRIIKDNIKNFENRISKSELNELCHHISSNQKRADECQREYEKIKKVRFMSKHLDKVFVGVISSITNRGMYITLNNTVRGMVRFKDIEDDEYFYNEKENIIQGINYGKIFRIGDKVDVEVVQISEKDRTIDFMLV